MLLNIASKTLEFRSSWELKVSSFIVKVPSTLVLTPSSDRYSEDDPKPLISPVKIELILFFIAFKATFPNSTPLSSVSDPDFVKSFNFVLTLLIDSIKAVKFDNAVVLSNADDTLKEDVVVEDKFNE